MNIPQNIFVYCVTEYQDSFENVLVDSYNFSVKTGLPVSFTHSGIAVFIRPDDNLQDLMRLYVHSD